MASITIQKGATSAYFTILDPTATVASIYPANSLIFMPDNNNAGYYSLFNKDTNTTVVYRSYTQTINGDTSIAFASLTALATYISTNFFA